MDDQKQHGTYDPTKKGNYTKKKYFSLKENTKSLFRILPPFGSLADKNQIAKYYSLTWLKDSKGRSRPVASILKKDNQTKTIIQRDPLFEKVASLKQIVENVKKAGKTAPEVIKEMEDRVYALQFKGGYVLNVMTPTGEIGALTIRYTAFQNLKTQLDTLAAQGIDAINCGAGKGVFFEFSRAKDDKGKTIYPVDIAKVYTRNPTTNQVTFSYMDAPADEVTLARMNKEAFDLGTMYKVFTEEEMTALSTLDPAVVDRVFARPQQNEAQDAEEPEQDEAVTVIPSTAVTTTIIKQDQTSTQGSGSLFAANPIATPTPVMATVVQTLATQAPAAQALQPTPMPVTMPRTSDPAMDEARRLLFGGK